MHLHVYNFNKNRFISLSIFFCIFQQEPSFVFFYNLILGTITITCTIRTKCGSGFTSLLLYKNLVKTLKKRPYNIWIVTVSSTQAQGPKSKMVEQTLTTYKLLGPWARAHGQKF